MAKPAIDLESDPLFVGYLPVPAPLVRFLQWTVPTLGLVIVALAIAAAGSRPDPGPAVWNDAKAREFKGTLIVDPYPLLVAPAGSTAGSPTVYLVVEMGKHGGRADLSALSGRSVTLSGWLLERDGRRLIELEPGEKSVRLDADHPAVRAERKKIGQVTLQGEIVDSKCYLGAMKPGEGKTHKACATLCIRGGMPPMLVSPSPVGGRDYLLLVDTSGGRLPSDFWPLISEPVQVTGELESLGDLRILRLVPNQIRPL
jgi:hypothetical protein